MTQGCLEIHKWVMVVVELRRNNISVMKTYEELVNERYREAVNGMFDDTLTSVFKAKVSDESI